MYEKVQLLISISFSFVFGYFFFKNYLPAPFPLKPEDIHEEVLLPEPLRDVDVNWGEKKLKTKEDSITIHLFGQYLSGLRKGRSDKKKIAE